MGKVSMRDVNEPLDEANRILNNYRGSLVNIQTTLAGYEQIEPINTCFEQDLQDMVNDMSKKVQVLIDEIDSVKGAIS